MRRKRRLAFSTLTPTCKFPLKGFLSCTLSVFFMPEGCHRFISRQSLSLSAGGFPTTGNTVPGRAAVWASRSGPCAACSTSTTAPTARCTASTAAARSPRAGEPATGYRAPPPGGRGRGQRFVPPLVNHLAADYVEMSGVGGISGIVKSCV